MVKPYFSKKNSKSAKPSIYWNQTKVTLKRWVVNKQESKARNWKIPDVSLLFLELICKNYHFTITLLFWFNISWFTHKAVRSNILSWYYGLKKIDMAKKLSVFDSFFCQSGISLIFHTFFFYRRQQKFVEEWPLRAVVLVVGSFHHAEFFPQNPRRFESCRGLQIHWMSPWPPWWAHCALL